MTNQTGRLDLATVHSGGRALPAGRSAVPPGGLLHVPAAGPSRIVLLLHGATQDAEFAMDLLAGHADKHGLLLYAPKSGGVTWDVIRGGYGPDVARIEAELRGILASTGPLPLTIGGFSDGASYAASLGIINGDIFDSVLAYSPGFAAPTSATGRPDFYVSHGTADRILPIERCGRKLAGTLEDAGYPVRYDEFEGGHTVPADIIEASLAWLNAR